jgi:hypothetical protein
MFQWGDGSPWVLIDRQFHGWNEKKRFAHAFIQFLQIDQSENQRAE